MFEKQYTATVIPFNVTVRFCLFFKGESRFSGKWVRIYNGMGVRFADFSPFF